MKFSFDPIHDYKTFICLLNDTPYKNYTWEYDRYDLVVRMTKVSEKYSSFTVLKSEFRKPFAMTNIADQTKFMMVCTKFVDKKEEKRDDEWGREIKEKSWNKYHYNDSYKYKSVIKESKRYKNI